MEFSASALYSAERLLKFNKFVAFGKKWVWILMSLATLICIGAFVLTWVFFGFDYTGLVCAVAIVALDVFYLVVYFVLPKSTVKKSPSLDATVNFEFYHDHFKATAETKTGHESAEHRYALIIKAKENNGDLYLYIAKQQAYILDITTIEPSNYENFKLFLKNRNITTK